MINGGQMRRQFGANKNQSVNTPFRMQLSITFLLVSSESNSTASHKPNERMHFIFGCLRDVTKASLLFTSSIIFSSSKAFIAAMPAAQHSGCPPKVVI